MATSRRFVVTLILSVLCIESAACGAVGESDVRSQVSDKTTPMSAVNNSPYAAEIATRWTQTLQPFIPSVDRSSETLLARVSTAGSITLGSVIGAEIESVRASEIGVTFSGSDESGAKGEGSDPELAVLTMRLKSDGGEEHAVCWLLGANVPPDVLKDLVSLAPVTGTRVLVAGSTEGGTVNFGSLGATLLSDNGLVAEVDDGTVVAISDRSMIPVAEATTFDSVAALAG
ncbi:MAG: hypothetical protein ACK5O2_08865 [Microthrixaceae bacterium]